MDIKKFKGNKITYLIIILAAGIFLVMLSGNSSKKNIPDGKNETQNKFLPDTHKTEERLEQIIGEVAGVSDVSVFVTYENTGVKKIAVLTQEDISDESNKKSSSVKSEVVSSKDGSCERPFVNEEVLPKIRGVIICAKGMDDINLRNEVSDAVSSALGVPLHRVKILPKE